jgi:alkylated DNA repair dioxygenase AlkB
MVVSVSLGATRNFDLHPVSGGARAARFQLGHGDLLVMGPHVQAEFVHSIAKTRAVTGPRISLTFRHYLEQH